MESNSSGDIPQTFTPKLIHRVLLTDPSQFGRLTVSGNPPNATTPSYDNFVSALSSKEDVPNAMKRAFRDQLCSQIYTTQNMEPLQHILLELHCAMRSLVPNRKDLHSLLNDDNVRQTTTPMEIIPFVLEAGQMLVPLESEARSESTQAWIRVAKDPPVSNDAQTSVLFLVNSVLFLLAKAELCQADKQDFYLANLWAPRIHAHARALELGAFEKRFQSSTPLTRQWIQELVDQHHHHQQHHPNPNRSLLRDSPDAQKKLIKMGWIEDILFRSSERSAMMLPEILALDDVRLQSIRALTKVAAAGSALALHACNAAGNSSTILNEIVEKSDPIELRRMSLVQAMHDRNVASQEAYEQTVATSVVALAKEWNPSLGTHAIETLQSRTSCVLSGEDPVTKLLDNRMKEAFRNLVLWEAPNVPLELRSGRTHTAFKQGDETVKLFESAARDEFCKRGLSFYATDLVHASWMAVKVIDLAWKVFRNDFLDEMITNACNKNSSTTI